MRPYEGLLTAMVTPFHGDGTVNEEAAVALGRHLLANGSNGLVVGGTTGESATLTDDELATLVALMVGELGDEGTIVAGAGSNSTHHAVELTERVVAAGAHAVLSVTPYYNKPNRRGLRRHFEEVARAAGDRGPQPPQHGGAEAVERGPARGLTERPPRLPDYGHASL